ncbi:hypothetical protein EJ08DRAFT_618392 [Tothia fuscella]|uniref:DUF3533 domain-containing protein n=1 Tax=Tothia fuscella TaxID=1048955 RepID=A0A9P4NJQ5_9PEZI|nr:hypothetical protein EJ08DRAFT_618392 [Tothia fuscella]
MAHNQDRAPSPWRATPENKSEDGENLNGAEKGAENGKKDPESPQPVGFWDPRLKAVRHEAFKKWLLTTVVLMAFILSVLSIYWAAFFHIPRNFKSLVVYIVDFDGAAPFDTGAQPLVGPIVTQLGQRTAAMPNQLGYGSLPPSHFNNDPLQVRQSIFDFHAWAAIIINPNATSMLYSAISTGNTSYDPLGALQLVYLDSRDSTTWSTYIFPLISQFMTEVTSRVGQEWAQIALQNASNPATLNNIQRVPQALSPAVGFSEYNLRPFYPYTATPAVSIGLIYLIILSFFSFSFYLPIHMKYLKPEGHPPLKFWQLILWRWLATIAAYVFLSLAYSLVSLAFQLNFSGSPAVPDTSVTAIVNGNPDAYGKGTFLVYWMLNFWGMIALGLACENVAMTIGNPWMGLWLIFWVITNVSTSFYEISTEPRFYHWGYAWPLHQVVEGSRSILFGLHSRIGLNFGILIAWGAVNTALFPFCCYWMRLKSKKGIKEYWA